MTDDNRETETEKDLSELATRAEEPIEERLVRAYVNGFREGMQRASHGRLDHW